jgi:2'-5' RNA ligase
MPFTVQLDVDATTNAALDGLAERLDAIPGLATIRRLGDVHHVSLCVCDTMSTDGIDADLAGFAEDLAPIDISLGAIGIFAGQVSVLYLAPVVTDGLLALHRRFHAAFAGLASWEHYHPTVWVPHVTLAMDVTPEALSKAVLVVREHWRATTARLDGLRLIRFQPVETLFHRHLG